MAIETPKPQELSAEMIKSVRFQLESGEFPLPHYICVGLLATLDARDKEIAELKAKLGPATLPPQEAPATPAAVGLTAELVVKATEFVNRDEFLRRGDDLKRVVEVDIKCRNHPMLQRYAKICGIYLCRLAKEQGNKGVGLRDGNPVFIPAGMGLGDGEEVAVAGYLYHGKTVFGVEVPA